MLQVLHEMLGRQIMLPVFGMNRGTVGFLMNDWRADALHDRIATAKAFAVTPLAMTVLTMEGETVSHPAINEVSLLRETRQTAKIEVSVDGRVAIPELVCDGVLVAPLDLHAEALEQLEHGLDVADPRHVAHDDLLLGEQGCRQRRERAVLVPGRRDGARQRPPALDHELLHAGDGTVPFR